MKLKAFVVYAVVLASGVVFSGTARAERKIGIERDNGQPVIVVDGERLPPMTVSFNMVTLENMAKPFSTNAEDVAYFARLRRAGLRVFFLGVTTRWNFPGDPAKGLEDGIARAKTGLRTLLGAVPDAWVILRLNVSPPCSWVNAHPEEQVRFSDGKTRPAMCVTCYPDGKLDGMYSMCSDAWRARGAQAVEEFFAEFSKEPGFDRVIGTFLGAGGTEEWYYPQVLHQEDGAYGDFSEPFRREYGRYLREKYGTEENLRRAWKRPDATFAHPPIPTPAEKAFAFDAPETIELGLVYREGAQASKLPKFDRDARGPYNKGTFLDLDAAPHVADFFSAWHLGSARSLVHFAKVLKRVRPNLLVGAFFGSLGQTNYLEGGSAGGVRHVLDSGVVDFLAAPGVYKNRRPGGCVGMREAQDSFRIRNMIFFDETDMATHLRRNPEVPAPPRTWPGAGLNWWALDTPGDTADVLKREFARVLCAGIQGWWFDWPFPRLRWYDDPSILALFARQQEVARESFRSRRPKASEIAFVLDPDSSRLVSRITARTVLDYWRVTDFARIGAPIDCYLLDDFAHPEMPDYKLYVMANAYSMTPERRAAVWRKARRNGATVLWLYAAGYANPEGTARLSATNVAETVGFPMGLIDKTFFPQFRVEDNTKRFVKGANRARGYGDLSRPVEEGPAIRLAPQRYVNPGFFVNDPEATVLGRYQDGRVAMAAKRVGGFTSVYCGSLVLESDLLRRVAEGAGCHLYLRTDDVLYANGDFVAVHADGDGRRKVRFREKCSPYEVYEQRSYGTDVDEIEVDMRNGQTLMWRLD